MEQMKRLIEKQSRRKANALLFLGSSVLISEFALITCGTYMFFSWDVMEPISYMVLYANFWAGFFFYALRKRSLELESVQDILTQVFSRRAYRKKGFDIKRYEELVLEIEELRQIVKKAI